VPTSFEGFGSISPQRQRGGALFLVVRRWPGFYMKNASITNMKQQYRQQALKRRRDLTPEERLTAATHIQNALLSKIKQQGLTTVPMLIYRAMKDEVDTRQLLSMDRTLMFAPVTHGHGAMQWREVASDTCWETGKFGIAEPVGGRLWEPASGKAVLISPLVGFDRTGNRLGLGTGCFDRWLGRFGEHLLGTIGLAFACQEVPAIPVEPHDVPLDTIITEREIIECRKQ